MLDPSTLYSLEFDGDPADAGVTVLVLATGAMMDAGHVSRQIARELRNNLESDVVARFDIDQLIDYRSRRPSITFDRDRFTAIEMPELLVHRVIDTDGTAFLLLDGPEPDFQWERVTEAIIEIIDDFGINLTVAVHGIPMGVPHTRPIGITRHATDDRLIPDNQPIFGEMSVPASFASILEFRLGEMGRDALGLNVHVPHYLTQSDMPEAALTGLRAIVAATGLGLPTTTLAVASGVSRAAIDNEVASSEDALEMVRHLEEQYDRWVEGAGIMPFAPSLEELPTADEIGAELEHFLRTQDDE